MGKKHAILHALTTRAPALVHLTRRVVGVAAPSASPYPRPASTVPGQLESLHWGASATANAWDLNAAAGCLLHSVSPPCL